MTVLFVVSVNMSFNGKVQSKTVLHLTEPWPNFLKCGNHFAHNFQDLRRAVHLEPHCYWSTLEH